MRTHTVEAEIEVTFVPAGLQESETAYPTVEIEFAFTPGCPETGPSYASGGEPACPAEVEFVKATLHKDDGLLPTQDQIDDWARKWLDDEPGYGIACEMADADDLPDPDYARDLAIEDRQMGWD